MSEAFSSRFHGVSLTLSPATEAKKMLSQFWSGTLPVDPMEIAEKAGLQLRVRSSFDDEPYPFSGHFSRDEGLIEVNGDEPRVRRRFTVAHELGHYALNHKDAPRDPPSAFTSAHASPLERAANQFAAELLMPGTVLKKLVQTGQYKTVDELARAFDVSKVAMTYRINNLGLFV